MAIRFRQDTCNLSEQAIARIVSNPTVPYSPIERARRLGAFFRQVLGIERISLMLLSSLLITLIELAGLALIFPFLKLATDPAFYQRTIERLADLGLSGADIPNKTAVVAVGLCLTAVYLLKGFVHVKLVAFQARVASDITKRTSEDLIRQALYSRFQLFQDHGAVKIAGISYSNTTHATMLFQALMSAANELVLLGLLFIAITVATPWLSILILLVLALVVPGFFLPLSRRAARIGRETQVTDLARHRFVFAMANAIRDIKIMGLEFSFSERNRVIAQRHADLAADYVSVSATQRIAVEAIMVSAIVGTCIWFSFTEQDLVAQAPFLVTMGLVAVRAAPALSRLAAAYSGFRYSLPFVEGLLEMRADIFGYVQPYHAGHVDFTGTYAARNLRFSYRDNLVLNDVSIDIPRGGVSAVVGGSGAGKSTLLDLLAGLQPAEAGTFSMDESAFDPFGNTNFSSKIGYVPQQIALLDSSLAYNISLEEQPDPQRLNRAIEQANLSAFVGALPAGVDTVLGEGGQGVSGGQRQRIGIARALYRQPALLILDEATSALDPDTAAAVMAELMQLRGQTTLLIVTHNLSAVSHADRVYRLENGKLFLDRALSKTSLTPNQEVSR
jgi:ABC-type bacteriocin/lantibiotic exporter with double-glycine peptidase domain